MVNQQITVSILICQGAAENSDAILDRPTSFVYGFATIMQQELHEISRTGTLCYRIRNYEE